MEQGAKLITAVAALLSAVAWPVALLAIVLILRDPIRAAVGRLKSLKVAGFEAQIEAQAAPLVEQAVADPGTISVEQIRAATRLEMQARLVGDQDLREQLERLCLDYERIRSLMPSGRERTRAMTSILVSMRTLGPSVAGLLPELKSSSAAGKRLAAVAVMQIQPDRADLDWLVSRFQHELPFVFYHAAIALQSVARGVDAARAKQARLAAGQALEIIGNYKGTPDRESVAVLRSIASSAP